MTRRQILARFGRQGRSPEAPARTRRGASRQTIQFTAGSGLKGDRSGRHTLDINPDSFLYVGPAGLDARIGDDLQVAPGSPKRLGLSASVRADIERLRSENARLAEENAALSEANAGLSVRVGALEAAEVTLSETVVELDTRLAALEVVP
jgi:hypothetical protein